MSGTDLPLGPFAAIEHRLPNGALIRPLGADAAGRLAGYCAGIDPYRRLGLSQGGLTAYLTRRDPALFRFAITMDAAPTGVLAVRSPWLRGPFLEMLALLPEGRGHGLGRAVLDWVAAEARQIAPNLWTTVSDFNADARAFYAHVGFEQVSELPALIVADSSEFLLRRRL